MARKNEKPETQDEPEVPAEETFTDGWLSWVLLALFLLICLVAWLLVQRRALQGAPSAPVGSVFPQPCSELRVANSPSEAYK